MIEGCRPMRRLATTTVTTGRVRRPISSVCAHAQGGVEDMAFTWSDWQRGIEPWRFNVPTSSEVQPDAGAHGVRPHPVARGRTVSMKHYCRLESRRGFDAPPGARAPDSSPMWAAASSLNATGGGAKPPPGGLSAVNEFAIPPAAKLGEYEVEPRGAEMARSPPASSAWKVQPAGAGRAHCPTDSKPLVRALGAYRCAGQLRGGRWRGQLPVRVSALVRSKDYLQFADYDMFSFTPPPPHRAQSARKTTMKKPALARTRAWWPTSCPDAGPQRHRQGHHRQPAPVPSA